MHLKAVLNSHYPFVIIMPIFKSFCSTCPPHMHTHAHIHAQISLANRTKQ